MAANNVLYDVTILSIRPAGTPKSLSLLNDWITANKGRGEFLACWYTEIGALNRVLLIRLGRYATRLLRPVSRD